jgi:hypothetical protein
MTSTNLIREFHFDSVDEFLGALLPTSNVWKGVQLSQNIFRGHANSEWRLLPTALRSPQATNSQQRNIELRAVCQFLTEVDRQGLAVPGDSPELRELWLAPSSPAILGSELLKRAGRDDFARRLGSWPPPQLWQGLALAQHHGVATRLLDWSRLSTVAAYFAALGAAQALDLGTANERIAVWACHENILYLSPWIEPEFRLVHLVTAPRSGNPNLHAQHGVFTLTTPRGMTNDSADNDPFKAISFDMVLQRTFEHCSSVEGNVFTMMVLEAGPPLRKLTLPVAQAPRLLEHLDALGVSATTLFPGFEGAARGALERQLVNRLKGS